MVVSLHERDPITRRRTWEARFRKKGSENGKRLLIGQKKNLPTSPSLVGVGEICDPRYHGGRAQAIAFGPTGVVYSHTGISGGLLRDQ